MDFQESVRISFNRIKQDYEAIKQNVTDWIFSINRRQGFLERKIVELEQRVRQLEKAEQNGFSGRQNGRLFR